MFISSLRCIFLLCSEPNLTLEVSDARPNHKGTIVDYTRFRIPTSNSPKGRPKLSPASIRTRAQSSESSTYDRGPRAPRVEELLVQDCPVEAGVVEYITL